MESRGHCGWGERGVLWLLQVKRAEKYQYRNQPLITVGNIFKQKSIRWLLFNQLFTKSTARKKSRTNLYASHLIDAFSKSGTGNKILKRFSGVTLRPHCIYIPQTHQTCCQNPLAFFSKSMDGIASRLSFVITPSVVKENQNNLVLRLDYPWPGWEAMW